MSARTQRFVARSAAGAFLFFGVSKLALPAMAMAQFRAWQYPGWFAFVVAPLEVAAGTMLLWPRRRTVGAALGLALMAGALFTHARTPQVGLLPLAPLAVVLLLACGYVAAGQLATVRQTEVAA